MVERGSDMASLLRITLLFPVSGSLSPSAGVPHLP